MILRPSPSDVRIVVYHTSRIITGLGILMVLPLATSLCFGEWKSAADFAVGTLACLTSGFLAQAAAYTNQGLTKRHGFVVVALAWLVGAAFGAIPYQLSGHFQTFTDCYFDVMSGLTTTGLFLLQDLDHVSIGMNMWRFVLTFVGGQGIVILALTFLFRGVPGTFLLSASEGKEERLVPHAVGTAKLIWLVSLAWLVVGTLTMTAVLLFLGETPVRSVLHGLWMFMGAFSTGGFAPQSYNTVWFHSFLFEIVSIVVFFAGSLNFALHWAVWTGKRSELRKNIEIRSFVMTLGVFFLVATYALAQIGVYSDTLSLVRKSFYLLISGHTTTGFGTVYARTLVVQWGPLAMLAIIGTMVIGGSAGSTAGGIKGMRIGIITKTFVRNIRAMISPDSAVLAERYHHIKNQVVTDSISQNALSMAVMFLTMHALVTAIGVAYGYPLIEAAFDGISAASNTGLSSGVISPGMPKAMKIALTIAMWMGRMEFLSVFALIGWSWSFVRGK